MLTLEDRELLLDTWKSTEFEDRADFIIASWEHTRAEAMGGRFDFESGVVPDGYSPVLEDSREGTVGSRPAGWSFWSRA